jgi:hypothetical protein
MSLGIEVIQCYLKIRFKPPKNHTTCQYQKLARDVIRTVHLLPFNISTNKTHQAKYKKTQTIKHLILRTPTCFSTKVP